MLLVAQPAQTAGQFFAADPAHPVHDQVAHVGAGGAGRDHQQDGQRVVLVEGQRGGAAHGGAGGHDRDDGPECDHAEQPGQRP
ncbi:hypothetical protein [Paractinoplanes durhamensis]|uniref:hypothetical protein n=1 Tax=Paractinoplanes durhamensis TaxID=113563 RepID=UPI0036310007